ncbi:spore maturation protein [Bacillus solimangrovi]|uniref:Spore maturation protein n=1 Tax=Bacillus solimangrovi TaxID=1305675 RepID=A0A1E5LHG8_9BACI|nr:spore maturation protein [Bacillus solimangrovi]OEH93530.1 spore maturation protein [Bacillus solimangrovi]
MAILSQVSLWLIPALISIVLLYGLYRRTPVYESFVDGGKEGIKIAISIIPYLVGMFVAIAMFRASGVLDFIISFVRPFLEAIGVPPEIIPLAMMRPISGTAALGITSDLISTYGADSFIGRLASTMQGSTDTTLYILTVYFGAVGIKKMGNALKVGLLADIIGAIVSIVVVSLVFGLK